MHISESERISCDNTNGVKSPGKEFSHGMYCTKYTYGRSALQN